MKRTQTEFGTIVITGGGTGGHLFPAIAVADAIRSLYPDIQIVFIGRDSQRDRDEIEKRSFTFHGFELEGLKRKFTIENIRAIWLFAKAAMRIRSLLRQQNKGVIFGVGGYVSAPTMIAGKTLGWTLTLHEQNTIPGLVNRMLASRCDRVYITYESTQRYLKGIDCAMTGFPLRRELLQSHAARNTKHGNQSVSILVIGGSQGARSVVEHSLKAFALLDQQRISYQALVQTGERNYEWAQTFERPGHVSLTPFIHNMAEAYQMADIVISRAGSGSLSEISFWGLPSILIPYPYASENHQLYNAKTFVQSGAAILIEEEHLTPEYLSNIVLTLILDESKRFEMGRCSAALARPDAADVIASDLIDLVKG